MYRLFELIQQIPVRPVFGKRTASQAQSECRVQSGSAWGSRRSDRCNGAPQISGNATAGRRRSLRPVAVVLAGPGPGPWIRVAGTGGGAGMTLDALLARNLSLDNQDRIFARKALMFKCSACGLAQSEKESEL